MRKLIICIFMVLGGCLLSFAQHPSLLFTQEEVNEMREGKGTVPAFDKTLSEVLSAADAALNSPISVPIPADGGGGWYTNSISRTIMPCSIAELPIS